MTSASHQSDSTWPGGRSRPRSCAWQCWGGLVVLGLSLSLDAADSGCQQPSEAGIHAPGLKAYVDPLTGELISEPPASSSPDEGLSAPRPADYPPVEEQVRPDGTVVADVGDRFITQLRAEVIDGQLVTCHRSPAATLPPQDQSSEPAEARSGRGG